MYIYTLSLSLMLDCSTNKTDRHDIAEILLKVAKNSITITLTPTHYARIFNC